MGTITYAIPTAGSTLNSVADPQISTALQTLLTWANGNVDAANIAATLAQAAGVNQGTQTVKGATNIATSESRSNVAYGTLTTPDQVTGIVLSANGLIRVWYQASWQESVSGAGRVAIFIGSNQLRIATELNAPPLTQAAGLPGGATAATNRPLASAPFGLVSTPGSTGYVGDTTTGQAVGLAITSGTSLYHELNGSVQQVASGGGGPALGAAGGHCDIFAAAGTYTISVQFKASSGSVTASNRKLWVQALSFT